MLTYLVSRCSAHGRCRRLERQGGPGRIVIDGHRSPEVLVSNARTRSKPRRTQWSRHPLVKRVLAARPAAHVAAEMGVSRVTAYKGLARLPRLRRGRQSRPLEPPAQQSTGHRSRGRGPVGVATRASAGAGKDPDGATRSTADHAPGPDPVLHATAGMAESPNQRTDPPLRAWPVRRAAPRGREGHWRLRENGVWRAHGRDSLKRRARAATRWVTSTFTPRATITPGSLTPRSTQASGRTPPPYPVEERRRNWCASSYSCCEPELLSTPVPIASILAYSDNDLRSASFASA